MACAMLSSSLSTQSLAGRVAPSTGRTLRAVSNALKFVLNANLQHLCIADVRDRRLLAMGSYTRSVWCKRMITAHMLLQNNCQTIELT